MRDIQQAINIIKESMHLIAFCGAGISVESGIPPFRGSGGLWNQYDPATLDLDTYLKYPRRSWPLIKKIFYDFFGKALPNPGHYALAELEKTGFLKAIITQNIDNLHQAAGSRNVIEFHGNSHSFVCTVCGTRIALNTLKLSIEPPQCPSCQGLLKPDFVFFGEMIPEVARDYAFQEAELADAVLVIGTSGEIMPACLIPHIARQNGARIIEINPGFSVYQNHITHIHLASEAGKMLPRLAQGVIGG